MTKVTFSDLTHTGVVIDANYIPLAVGYVAAYAKKNLGDKIEPRLFRYPDALERFLAQETPAISCFSNYMWNERLQLEFARRLKERSPKTVTVFGGPNFPTDVEGQRRFVEAHPEIDFYIDGEGEPAFVELFKALESFDFDAKKLKKERRIIPSVCYIHDGSFIRGELLPRINDLDAEIPSPYLMGLMDEFFDDKLHPLMQTSRGCPYSCTFCHDGISYMSKTRRFSQERIRAELDYISKRVKVPGLTLADLNWGMFPEDIQTAHDLAKLQKEIGWPKHIASATSKNQKERIIEMGRILGDSIRIGASIQSTDAEVLRNIKRTNIGFDTIVKMAKESRRNDASTFSEIILGLPGDTKEKHLKSICDMLDLGIQEIFTYQFIMLPGTEAAEDKSREKYRYETRFRVLPRCFGRYTVIGKDADVGEIHEVCVGHATLPHEDYLACRDFDLSVAMFTHGNVFDEVFGLAAALGVPRSALMMRTHDLATKDGGDVAQLYRDFRDDETKNFWKTNAELEAFLAKGGLDAYRSGKLGSNQILRFRARAIFELLAEASEIIFTAMRQELSERGLLDAALELYLKELQELLLARKSQVGETTRDVVLRRHFDFPRIAADGYLVDPRLRRTEQGSMLRIRHSESQRKAVEGFLGQYGTNLAGLAYFIGRHPIRMLFRGMTAAQEEPSTMTSARAA